MSSHLACFENASCQLGEILAARNWGWPLANDQQKKLSAANNHEVSSDMDTSPLESSNATTDSGQQVIAALCETTRRGLSKPTARLLTHKNCEVMDACCFKMMDFGMLLHIMIEN